MATRGERATRRRARRRARRRGLRLVGYLAAWLLVAALGLAAVLRVTWWDGAGVLVVLNVASLYLYLPAWLVAPLAALRRHWLLAAAALGVAGAQLAFVLPELTAARTLPSWALSAPQLRLLDANVGSGNPSMAGYAAQIRADRPELVTLEEVTTLAARQLAASGALRLLPHRFEVDRDDPWGFLVASRYRLGATRVISLFERPLVVETTLELPAGPLALWVVHTVAPLPVSWQQWSAQLALVARLARARRPGRLLVVGDFNATWQSRGFRAVLAGGLTDGAAARGEALDMTWSQQLGPLPPLVRIDHVLAGPGVSVVSIHSGVGVGSDHRDLRVTVAVER